MKIMLIALLGGALFAAERPLANGVYGVETAECKTCVTRQHEGKKVVIDTAQFAPFTLAGKPEIVKQGDAKWLSIQLAPEAAKRLAELTRSHIDRPIAVVVGDKVLATPTVRDVIADGKARVTSCEDGSCETLLRELTK